MRYRIKNILAVVFCILLVLSMTTPAFAYTGPDPTADRDVVSGPTDDRSEQAVSPSITNPTPQVSPPQNGSSLRLRLGAYELLNKTTFPGNGNRKDRLLATLNATFSGYVSLNRTTAPPFTADEQVASEALQHNEEVARWLVEADAVLARTAIADVRTARDQLLAGNVSFDRKAVQRDLQAAERAYDQGRTVEDDSPVGAIGHYRRAWLRAQSALDQLDRAQAPNVTLVRRTDPPRNGTLNYTLAGEVVDVRTYEIDSVTVRINDQRNLTVPVRVANTSPGAVGRFNTTLQLDRQVNRITVTAVDPNEDLGDLGGDPDDGDEGDDGGDGNDGEGNDGPPDEGGNGPPDQDEGDDRGPPGQDDENDDDDDDQEDEDDGDEGDDEEDGEDDDSDGDDQDDDDDEAEDGVGRAILRLDGDGLPDRYELSVSETDPLDPDSDSACTDINESDNEVIDGLEDFDGDTVPTVRERAAGTDPFDADTDGDTLRDFPEIFFDELSPTDPDTAGDGVRDDRADPDDDGLSTGAEIDNGSSPFEPDSDLDGLNDSAELQDYGTDPTALDTDEDGLRDDEELDLPTDPTDPDTDGDGVLDGNETFTTTASNESLDVRVDISGEGTLADEVTIENGSAPAVTSPAVSNASVSPIVDLTANRSFERANVTIGYNESAVPGGNESDLLVFTFDPDLGTYVPLNTTIDEANDTATAQVPHFSRFVVFSYTEWEDQFPDDVIDNRSGSELFNSTIGWKGDARIENESIVVESNGSTGDVIVVAKDGSGDFEAIQPAVNAARDNATIYVKNGTYHEEVVLNSSVRVVGPNATLSGTRLGENTAGIRVKNGTSPIVGGFTISACV